VCSLCMLMCECEWSVHVIHVYSQWVCARAHCEIRASNNEETAVHVGQKFTKFIRAKDKGNTKHYLFSYSKIYFRCIQSWNIFNGTDRSIISK
jgi:hypothetical protein